MMRRMTLVLAWLLAMATTPPARAEPPAVPSGQGTATLEHLPALKGDYFALTDRGSGRVHHLYVRYPEGYDAAAATRYPVVYVLDGDSLFPLLAPTHLFLHYDEKLPEAIIVGIAYGGFDPAINKRHVDFTAPSDDTGAEQGGAPGFLAFLRAQVLPEVERRYAADPTRRVLLGQSRAGYFVLWSAVQDPDLFWGRIASNPSPGPARDALFAAPRPHASADLRVAVVSGARDTAERQRIAHDWTTHWAAPSAGAPWDVTLVALPDGTHAASIGEGYRRAMLWLFRGDIALAPAQ
jgi:predicted alpha/beta superfamily hydrolase